MPQIGCTWGVDVHKNPVRQHHVSVARWSDEMVIQAPGRSEQTGYYSPVNTFHAQYGIMQSLEVCQNHLKKASKYKRPHPRHVELVRWEGRCWKKWVKLPSKSQISSKFEASDRQWTPKEIACDPSLGSGCGAQCPPPITPSILTIFTPSLNMIMMPTLSDN